MRLLHPFPTRRSPMGHSSRHLRTRQIETLRRQFAQTDGLAFVEVLPAQRLKRALLEERVRWREKVFTPVVTLWAFLTQVASPDGSCRAAVARVLAWLVSQGEKPCSPETDPYCKARQRLPETLLPRLARETAGALHAQAAESWHWHGRRV